MSKVKQQMREQRQVDGRIAANRRQQSIEDRIAANVSRIVKHSLYLSDEGDQVETLNANEVTDLINDLTRDMIRTVQA